MARSASRSARDASAEARGATYGVGMKLLDRHPIAARSTSALLALVAAGCAAPDAPRGGMDIRVLSATERRVAAGSAAWFTGTAHVEMLFGAAAPSRVGGANVRFEPGARTHWHTHPLGQTLVVTAGRGWVQRQGQPPQPITEAAASPPRWRRSKRCMA